MVADRLSKLSVLRYIQDYTYDKQINKEDADCQLFILMHSILLQYGFVLKRHSLILELCIFLFREEAMSKQTTSLKH